MDPAQRVLFLWRNDNTVVIGRAQNPWKECNTRRMEEDGVTLARRSSRGRRRVPRPWQQLFHLHGGQARL